MAEREGRHRLDLVASPVFALSVVTLLFNDRVLKQAWPGVVTGKLSDVAGVAMIAVLLTALARSRAIGCVLAGAGFAALKTFDTVAEAAAPILGGVTLTDGTDLVALAVLMPVWHWMGAAPARPRHPTTWRVGVRTVLIGAAVLATSATSCMSDGVQGLAVQTDGSILADTTDGMFVSNDGGVTWEMTDASWDWTEPWNSSCLADGTCFEIEPRRVVLVQDGQRTVDFELTEEQVNAVYEFGDSGCYAENDRFGSVAAVDTPEGAHVVVSMGSSGIVHRYPDGVWRWERLASYGVDAEIGSPNAPTEPQRETPTSVWLRLSRWVLLLSPVLVALAAIPLGLRARGSHAGVTGVVLLTLALAGVLAIWAGAVFAVSVINEDGPLEIVGGIVAVVLIVGCLWPLIAMARRRAAAPAEAGGPPNWPAPEPQ